MKTKKRDRNDVVRKDLFKGWKGKWSEWFPIMKAKRSKGCRRRKYKKDYLPGYKATNAQMKKMLGRYYDGIYEWRSVDPTNGKKNGGLCGKNEFERAGSSHEED